MRSGKRFLDMTFSNGAHGVTWIAMYKNEVIRER